jgi:hypothetical protein
VRRIIPSIDSTKMKIQGSDIIWLDWREKLFVILNLKKCSSIQFVY